MEILLPTLISPEHKWKLAGLLKYIFPAPLTLTTYFKVNSLQLWSFNKYGHFMSWVRLLKFICISIRYLSLCFLSLSKICSIAKVNHCLVKIFLCMYWSEILYFSVYLNFKDRDHPFIRRRHFLGGRGRGIHIECSKQFEWKLYFYRSGQRGPFWAELKLL